MSRVDVEALVAAVRANVSGLGDSPSIAGFSDTCSQVAVERLHSTSASEAVLGQVAAAARNVPEIEALEGGLAYSGVGGGHTILMREIAQWLLANSRWEDPSAVVGRLLKEFERNRGGVIEVAPVWGVSPKEEFDLGRGYWLVPLGALPGSMLRDVLSGTKRHAYSFEIPGVPRPGGAIVRHSESQLYSPRASDAAQKVIREGLMLGAALAGTESMEKAMQALASDFLSKVEAMRRAPELPFGEQVDWLGWVVGLCAPKPIFQVATWTQRSDAGLPLVGRLDGWAGPTAEPPFGYPIEPQDYDRGLITEACAQYWELSEELKGRLWTPLSRLNRGRRELQHGSVESAALEIGIATEALLTADRDASQPVTHLVRLRTALFLGGSASTRRLNANLVRDLYKLRSKVAHEGKIVKTVGIKMSDADRSSARDASVVMAAAAELCRQLILKVLREGKVPDWAALELGGDDLDEPPENRPGIKGFDSEA